MFEMGKEELDTIEKFDSLCLKFRQILPLIASSLKDYKKNISKEWAELVEIFMKFCLCSQKEKDILSDLEKHDNQNHSDIFSEEDFRVISNFRKLCHSFTLESERNPGCFLKIINLAEKGAREKQLISDFLIYHWCVQSPSEFVEKFLWPCRDMKDLDKALIAAFISDLERVGANKIE